jgi:hypothetical protein
MNNSVLDFKIDFILNNSPKDLTFEDLTNYAAYGIALSKVTGNLKLTSPSSVFYINAGYVANDFSSPDIDANVSLSKSGIDLPVASNGDVLCGNYKFEYSIKVDYGIVVSSIVNNKFRTSLVGVNALLQTGNKIEIYDSTTGNNGIYTITGVTTAGVTTMISVAETIVGAFSAEKINIIYNTSKTVDYCFINPVVDIEVQSNCNTSILTSEDLTDYKVNGISPLITRTHTLIYPIDPSTGLPIHANVTGSTAVLTAGANIYTGMWTINISSVLEYSLNTWLTVNTIVQGQTYHKVICSLCLCLFYICYKAVLNKYVSMLGYNAREAERLNGVLTRLNTLVLLYIFATEKCGYDGLNFCEEIKTILNTENCTCDTEANDDVPVEVIPISSGGGGTTVIGSVWYNGTGVPSSSLGSNGDYYLDNATGNIYYLSGGVWAITTNIFGSAGSNGSTILNGSGIPAPTLGTNGDYYIDTASNDLYNLISGTWTVIGNIQGATGAAGQDGVALLHNDITTSYSTATNLEEVIKSFTLAAGVMSNGDMIEVETIIGVTLATPSNPLYYRVRFGGLSGNILNLWSYTNNGNYIAVSLKIQIIKISDTSARIKMYHNNYINSPNVLMEQIMNTTVDFTVANDIVITSENTKTIPAIGEITVSQLTVKLFKL